jgi:hypothetical protein
MKVKLRVHKDKSALYEGTYDVSDADSFGRACADLWNRLRDRKLTTATSIGALFDQINEQLLDDLYGAQISLSKA